MITSSITCFAFWTQRVWGLYRLYGIPVALFSGQFVQLQLMPKVIQDIAVYSPFPLFKYFPTQLILGKLSPEEIARGYIVGFIWIVLAFLLFRFVWSRGLKQYSAVGA